ncbi:hypothetical protein [Leptospira adleri]|uniref:hypothetical protein n=1 Tax=Leptospira adleri TaxID=2023186 RepID=UPI001082575C|nr:hypothetical protein [Leptospira adleri]TGM61577.1 hypothetical protein EHQ97_01045 [Leptospira adleri]
MGHIEKIIDRYGGGKLWDRLESIDLNLLSLGGPLLEFKGINRTFLKPHTLRITPKKFLAEFFEYPAPGKKTVYRNGAVDVFDSNEKEITFNLLNYRNTFHGLKKYRLWTSLDASYFFGYAIVQYLSIPFLLKEFSVREAVWKGGVRIDAEFPDTMHVHCRKQSYYFDSQGLLVRNDYTANVVGAWAHGSHFTEEYREVDGLPIATRRNVFVRLGRCATSIPVLFAELKPIRVNFF